MFFMFRFQHLHTINQTLQTENQTLKTVVPMFNKYKQAAPPQSQQNIRERQVSQGAPGPRSQSTTAPLSSEQTAAQQIVDNIVPNLDIGAPLPGYNGVDAGIEPGVPLPQTGMSPNVPMGMGPPEELINVGSSSTPASSQQRRGGLNPFPPTRESTEMPGQSGMPSQYGIGAQFQEPISNQLAVPPIEHGSASERAYV